MIFTGTSGDLSIALYMASLAEVGRGVSFSRVEIAAIAWGMNVLNGIMNTVGTRAIGRMSAFNVWWTLGGTFVFLVTLLVKAPVKSSPSFVFTDLENFMGYSSRGIFVLLGFLQAVYTLEGCETAARFAKEAQRSALLAPLAIVFNIGGSWAVGLAYMLALLFAVQSVAGLQATSYALPIAQLFEDAAGAPLAQMYLMVVALAQFMAAVTAFMASSCLLYALARDRAVPGPGGS